MQATLRRAVSTIYYAAFTCLANVCADKLVGQYHRLDDVGKRAWVQVYRSVDHGKAKSRCKNNVAMVRFPPSTRERTDHAIRRFVRRRLVNAPNILLDKTALSFIGQELNAPVVSWGVLPTSAQNFRTVARSRWLLIRCCSWSPP